MSCKEVSNYELWNKRFPGSSGAGTEESSWWPKCAENSNLLAVLASVLFSAGCEPEIYAIYEDGSRDLIYI